MARSACVCLVCVFVWRQVGFIVLTSDVDTGSLTETFDLHPYDNFLPPEVRHTTTQHVP